MAVSSAGTTAAWRRRWRPPTRTSSPWWGISWTSGQTRRTCALCWKGSRPWPPAISSPATTSGPPERCQETAALLADCGVTWLHNGFVTLQRGGDSRSWRASTTPNGYADQKTPQQVAREVRDAAPEGFWLLLAHRNNLFESEYAALGADLTLSGHGHGGLWRLPFTDGLLGSGGTLLPSYTNGFYTCRGAEVFVSRGWAHGAPVQPPGGGGADPAARIRSLYERI